MALEIEVQTYFWKGQKRYRCPYHPDCQWDTYSQDLMLKHLRELHQVKPDATANRAGILDSRGMLANLDEDEQEPVIIVPDESESAGGEPG